MFSTFTSIVIVSFIVQWNHIENFLLKEEVILEWQNFKTTLEIMPEALCVISKDDKLLFQNRVFEEREHKEEFKSENENEVENPMKTKLRVELKWEWQDAYLYLTIDNSKVIKG